MVRSIIKTEGKDPNYGSTRTVRRTSKSTLSPEYKKHIKEGKELNKRAEQMRQRSSSTLSDDDIRDDISSNNPKCVPEIVHVSDLAVSKKSMDDIKLPTPVKLSKELCRIVDLNRYTHVESVLTLEKLFDWAETKDPDYLRYFDRYSGVVKVLDFLEQIMKDSTCKGAIRMECIGKAALVIKSVCSSVEDGSNNNDVASKIASTLIECEGIDTLIDASREYTGGDNISQIWAVQSVLGALSNIILLKDHAIGKEKAVALFNTGVDIISQLKFVDGPVASRVLEHVFHTLSTIVENDYMTKQYFQYKKTLSESLDVFTKDDTWSNRTEKVADEAIYFFNICRIKDLLDEGSDYEVLLPFFAMGLKKFPSNKLIRTNTVKFLYHTCTTVNGRKHLEKAGAMESLSLLLTSDDISEEEKKTVRKVIVKIVAP